MKTPSPAAVDATADKIRMRLTQALHDDSDPKSAKLHLLTGSKIAIRQLIAAEIQQLLKSSAD